MSIPGATADVSQTDAAARPPPANVSVATIARRDARLIAAIGVGCALLAFAAGKLVPPRYVATAQIYVDPGPTRGAVAPGQDSNGFTNYVESQALIAASRSVLERVVKAQNLDRDPEFSSAAGGLLVGLLGRADGAGEDPVATAARALGANLRVERPERTFVLDLSVSSRDPARAAELANAAARAYLDESEAIHSDAAHQSGAAIAARLESLRAQVLETEKAVEDYKLANGLAGARDTLPSESQRKDLNDQIAAARDHMNAARTRADQIESARRSGGSEIEAIALQLNLTSLASLRTQQSEARRNYAQANAELGQRHPQVIEAQARLRAADAAVDAELSRLAQSDRADYARAKTLEGTLTHQLEDLEKQTIGEEKSMTGLRDLERKASAARDVYELSVNRTRDGAEPQQVEPTRGKIISAAAPPKTPEFPPNPYLLAGLGLLVGVGLGLLEFVRRARRARAQAPPAIVRVGASPAAVFAPEPASSSGATSVPPPSAPPSAGPLRLTVGASSPLRVHTRRQSLDRLDLIDLGFPALPDSADADEFEAVLKAVDFTNRRSRDPRAGARRRFVLVVVGTNEGGARTALAINLALSAVRGGARVALLDAAGRNAKLTRAVRVAARKPILGAGAIYETENGVRLALPKALDPERGRLRPEAMLRHLLDSREEALDLIVCDGPGANEVDAASVFEYANAIVALDEDDQEATPLDQLLDLGFAPSALVRFGTQEETMRKSA